MLEMLLLRYFVDLDSHQDEADLIECLSLDAIPDLLALRLPFKNQTCPVLENLHTKGSCASLDPCSCDRLCGFLVHGLSRYSHSKFIIPPK